jgi:hypothetical protein
VGFSFAGRARPTAGTPLDDDDVAAITRIWEKLRAAGG